MILKKKFDLAIYTYSKTAEEKGIDNSQLSEEQIKKLEKLHEIMLHISARASIKFAKPIEININSGYRCPALNKAVGGSNSSQHTKCEAVDSTIQGVPQLDYYKMIKELIQEGILELDQIIFENTWVHISFREGKNRKQFLKKVTINGKTAYEPF